MRAVVLGDDEQARRILVEPVDDAGPLDPADARQAVAAMGDERIHERAGFVTGGRMHHEPGRLVDDDEVIVLVDDVERDRFAQWLGRDGRGKVEQHRCPSGKLLVRIEGGGAVHGHSPVPDQRLEAAARKIAPRRCQRPVEPLRRSIMNPLTQCRFVQRILAANPGLRGFLGRKGLMGSCRLVIRAASVLLAPFV